MGEPATDSLLSPQSSKRELLAPLQFDGSTANYEIKPHGPVQTELLRTVQHVRSHLDAQLTETGLNTTEVKIIVDYQARK